MLPRRPASRLCGPGSWLSAFLCVVAFGAGESSAQEPRTAEQLRELVERVATPTQNTVRRGARRGGGLPSSDGADELRACGPTAVLAIEAYLDELWRDVETREEAFGAAAARLIPLALSLGEPGNTFIGRCARHSEPTFRSGIVAALPEGLDSRRTPAVLDFLADPVGGIRHGVLTRLGPAPAQRIAPMVGDPEPNAAEAAFVWLARQGLGSTPDVVVRALDSVLETSPRAMRSAGAGYLVLSGALLVCDSGQQLHLALLERAEIPAQARPTVQYLSPPDDAVAWASDLARTARALGSMMPPSDWGVEGWAITPAQACLQMLVHASALAPAVRPHALELARLGYLRHLARPASDVLESVLSPLEGQELLEALPGLPAVPWVWSSLLRRPRFGPEALDGLVAYGERSESFSMFDLRVIGRVEGPASVAYLWSHFQRQPSSGGLAGLSEAFARTLDPAVGRFVLMGVQQVQSVHVVDLSSVVAAGDAALLHAWCAQPLVQRQFSGMLAEWPLESGFTEEDLTEAWRILLRDDGAFTMGFPVELDATASSQGAIVSTKAVPAPVLDLVVDRLPRRIREYPSPDGGDEGREFIVNALRAMRSQRHAQLEACLLAALTSARGDLVRAALADVSVDDPPAVLEAARGFLRQGSTAEVLCACRLFMATDPASVTAALTRLASEDPEALALAYFDFAGLLPHSMLEALLAHRLPTVRLSACSVAARLGDPALVRALLEALRDEHESVRLAARHAIESIRFRVDTEAWLRGR